MDQWLRLTLRMTRMLRRGPVTRGRLILFFVVIGLALLIGLVERAGYWPEGWTVNKGRSIPRVQPL